MDKKTVIRCRDETEASKVFDKLISLGEIVNRHYFHYYSNRWHNVSFYPPEKAWTIYHNDKHHKTISAQDFLENTTSGKVNVKDLKYPDVVNLKSKSEYDRLFAALPGSGGRYCDADSYYLINNGLGGGQSASRSAYESLRYNIYDFNQLIFDEISVPEYVKCITLPTGWGAYTMVNGVYKTCTDGYGPGKYRILFRNGGQQTAGEEHHFRPATKKEFDDFQNSLTLKEVVPEEDLSGRWLKAKHDNPVCIPIKEKEYVQIRSNGSLESIRGSNGLGYIHMNISANWILMPKGFKPGIVEQGVGRDIQICSIGYDPYETAPASTLGKFPDEGYCETTDTRLFQYLNNRPNQEHTNLHVSKNTIGIAWGKTSAWTICGGSSKKEYTLEQLLPFLSLTSSNSQKTEEMNREQKLKYARENYKAGDKLDRTGFYINPESGYICNNPDNPYVGSSGSVYYGTKEIYCSVANKWAKVIGNCIGDTESSSKDALLAYARANFKIGDRITRKDFHTGYCDVVIAASNDISNNVPHFYGADDNIYLGQHLIYCGRTKAWAVVTNDKPINYPRTSTGKQENFILDECGQMPITTLRASVGDSSFQDVKESPIKIQNAGCYGTLDLPPSFNRNFTIGESVICDDINSSQYGNVGTLIDIEPPDYIGNLLYQIKDIHGDTFWVNKIKKELSTKSKIKTKGVGKIVLPPLEIKERRKL
jgi:hypothetical protein